MAMLKSAVARHYEYNPKAYSGVLNKIHTNQERKMKNSQLAQEAYELQTIFQEIKDTAKTLEKEPLTEAEKLLQNEYKDFILSTVAVENIARKSSGKSMKQLVERALFRRGNKTTKTINGADNILEEEIAALETALDRYFGGDSGINDYLAGTRSAEVSVVRDTSISKEVKKSIEERANEAIKEVADKFGAKFDAKKIMKGRSQKMDNSGLKISLKIGIDANTSKLARLAQLLKGASFTDKQYTRWGKSGYRDYSDIQLHLGNTNLYKAITGVISEEYSNPNIQRSIFFRGLQILKKTNDPPSATPQEVTTHFTHMRFMYELRGTGLTNEAGESQAVKYLIYNDPKGDAIFVRDTASIILEELHKERSNLFGEITLAASRAQSH